MLKKILALLLTAVMLAGVLVTGALAKLDGLPYDDVKSDDWFYDYVKFVYDNSLMLGVSDTRFDPEGKVTRAMFVTILGRLHGAEQSTSTKFTDVDFVTGDWYAGYVGWASDNGIVLGNPDNTFNPDGKLTREQMAAIILRYIDYTGIIPTKSENPPSYFTDEADISDWAKENVAEMRIIGLVQGNGGKFNPQGDLTRAEAATVMKRLVEMVDLLELGDPMKPDYSVDGENFMLMGAWDLYYGGTALDSSYEGVGVATDEEIPYLREDTNGQMFLIGASGDRTHDNNTSFGKVEEFNPLLGDNTYFEIDLGVANISQEEYPVVRFAYRTEGDAPLGFGYMVDVYSGLYVSSAEMYDFEEKSESAIDGGWKYGIVNLGTEVHDMWPSQFIASLISEADIELLYFAAFPDMESAEAFDVTEYKSELLSYDGDVVEVIEASEKDVEAAMDEAYDKAEEIVSYSGNIDTSTIKGTCYYISSENGDDTNSGTSPDAPWKTFTNLYRVRGNALQKIVSSNVKPGDAVLLERGSVFDKYRHGEFDCLVITEGVTYGTYGEGAKPQITARFVMDEPAGKWVESGYENVWKLDYENHDYPGNIEFVKEDGTELWGVCVFLDNYETPYNGALSKNYGFVTNGEDIFQSGGVPFTDPGCLKNNLEYFTDVKNGALYVYYNKGNPGEVFKEINITRKEIAIDDVFGAHKKGYSNSNFEYWSTYVTVVDGLSVKYAGSCGINTWEADNVYIRNCDFEWIGGSFENPESRYGNAVSNWGSSDGIFVMDCYFKDVYDAAASTQAQFGRLVNYYSSGCVLDRCGLSYEFFINDNTSDDGESVLANIFIKNNYVLNSGFGYCDIRTDRRGAFFISGYHVTNATVDENIVYEGNINFFSGEYALFGVEIALGKAPGAIMKNNIYYMDPTESYYGKLVYNLLKRSGSVSALYPYNSQYLTYLNSLGVEVGSAFYSAPNPDDAGNRK